MTGVAIRVEKIIIELLMVPPQQVIPEASFTNDLGASPTDLMELFMAFEDEFGISIPDEKAEKIIRVQDAVAYIETILRLS